MSGPSYRRFPTLVGGPLDGEMRAIEPHLCEFLVSTLDEPPFWTSYPDALEPPQPLDYTTHRYRLERLRMEGSDVLLEVWADSDMPTSTVNAKVWERLLDAAGAYPI